MCVRGSIINTWILTHDDEDGGREEERGNWLMELRERWMHDIWCAEEK